MQLKEGRKRNVSFIAYPESISYVALRDFLTGLGVKAAISPLHDEDVWSDSDVHEWIDRHKDKHGNLSEEDEKKIPEVGSKKKPHWHVVLFFSGGRYLAGLRKMCAPINIKTFWVIEEKAEYIRYLCHLDDVGKAQYDRDDVLGIGGIDLSPLWQMTESDKLDYFKLVIQLIKDEGITNFCDLVDATLAIDDTGFFQMVTEKTHFFGLYLTGMEKKLHSKRVVFLDSNGEIVDAEMVGNE